MIKILHVFGSLNLGGAETRTLDMIEFFDKQKFEFHFITHQKKNHYYEKIQKLGCKIHYVSRYNFINQSLYKREWLHILIENKFDIIHAHMFSTGFIFFPLAKKSGVHAIIAHSRSGGSENFLKRFLKRYSSLKADYWFSVSNSSAKEEFHRYIYNKRTFSLIENGFVFDKYKFNQDSRLKLKKLFHLEDTIVIGHIGRFTKVKNHTFLINIIFELQKKIPNIVLFLIGKGPLLNELKSLVDELDINKNVIIIDQYIDPSNYYSLFDLLIFPSLYEGFPGVVFEAQIAGLKCFVSSSISDEINQSGLVDFLDLHSSSKKWADYINARYTNNQLFNHDRLLFFETMKLSKYSINNTAKKVEQKYIKIFHSNINKKQHWKKNDKLHNS